MMSQDNRLLPSLPPSDRGTLDRPLSDFTQPKSYPVSHTEPAHLREYLSIVLKRKWLILSLVVVVTSLATIQMYRMPSVYEATTTIQIEPKRDSVLKTSRDQVVINTGRSSDPQYVNTQLQLLKNPALARQVVKALDLQNNPQFFGGQAQGGFVSSVRRIFSRNQKPAGAAPGEPGAAALSVVNEDEVRDKDFSPEELQRLEPYEDTIAASLNVEPEVGTNLFKLRYRHTNPELAQKIVNTVAKIFVDNNYRREIIGSEEAAEKLAEKIAELQGNIRDLEQRRFNWARDNNLPQTGKAGEDLEAIRLQTLSGQVLEAENSRKNLESLWKAASAATDPNAIPEIQDNARVLALRKQLDELQQRRAELLETYTENWPAVKQIDAKIATLNQALTKAPREVVAAMKSRYESAVAKENSLKSAYYKQRGTTTQQGLAQIQMGMILQDLETHKQEYNVMRARQREIENTAGDRPNNVSVVTASRLPREPVGPQRLRTIVLAFFLALGAGIGLAFLLDYLDDTLKTVDDVDRYIHLPALALIPASNSERPRLRGRSAAPVAAGGGESTAIALLSDVRSPIAEAYRHLRTSLLLSSAGQPPKTILVTSSQPSEGKTTTAINTAIMLAQTGAEVLIIDCDLRRPRIHANFGIPNTRGLTNSLSGEKDLDKLVQPYDKLPNLKILTAGPVPPNPAELLGSNEMRKLLNGLSERYTHIIIDSPPAISFTDASILSTLVDGVMLVVHGGRSSRAVVRRAKQQLIDVGANIFGVVLNNVKIDAPEYYYGGYYSSYYANEDYEDVAETAEGAPGRTS